jgi:outer membrane protein
MGRGDARSRKDLFFSCKQAIMCSSVDIQMLRILPCHKDLTMKRLSSLVLALSVLPCLAFAADPPIVSEATKPTIQQPAAQLPLPAAVQPEAPKSLIKLGYADMAKISAESSLGKASQAQAKAKQEKLQSQLQAKRKQLDKQKASIEATIASLSPAQREAKAKEFQKKVEAFQKLALNAEKEFQTLQEELSKSLYEAIEKASVEYGKSNNLALVVVKRELLYLANGVDAQDVSAGIIKLMDEKWAKK